VRIFLAGASGVIGIRLVPLLVAAGHDVAGATRSAARAGGLRELGAEPLVLDVFDAPRLTEAVVAFQPDLVMHQVTDLPDDAARIPQAQERNGRIRREGTRNLLDAAAAAGAGRFLAQSVAWPLPSPQGRASVEQLEQSVLAVGGVVLRYGQFSGPGTYYPGRPPQPPRIQIDDAAQRTVDVLDAPSGVITIVED
jgi:NAD(P)-dependent dehydrogenase (short-subunit alcohol dehydrogenase family)